MSQSSSASKGIPRDVIDKSRRDRAKIREKQKSDANQKAKKALEAAEKERLKYEGLRDKQKELYKNYDDGKHPEFKEEYENATKDFQDSRSKLADLQIVIKQAQADRISHYRFEHCTHGYLSEYVLSKTTTSY